MSDKKAELERIRDRYFRKVISHPEGMVTHFGFCDIYQAEEISGWCACTCGLLCDLRFMCDGDLARKVFVNYERDLTRQENQGKEPEPVDPETEERFREFLTERGVTFRTVEREPSEDENQWLLIAEVFGEKYATVRREEMAVGGVIE